MKTLLTAVVVIGLAAVAGAVIVGTRVFDGTVVEDPYERGIAWDEDHARLASSGLRAELVGKSFRTGENLVSLNVFQREEPFEGKSVTVEVSRPSSTAHDRTFTALRGMDGVFRAMIDLPLQGNWDLVLVVDGEEDPVRIRRRIYVGAKTPVEPSPPCDLNAGPCVAVLGESGTEVAFDMRPKPLKTMVPLQFTLATGAADFAAGDVSVDLSMPGMFMGENKVRLEPAGEGLWKGRGAIVRCPSGRNVWRAVVSVPGRGNAAFTFEVDR
jgi:nitrogen fixation protein FixH